jgi:hypothetical protein
MLISAVLLFSTGNPGFLGTYPTGYNDAITGVIETPSGYIAYGLTDEPAGFESRYLVINILGECITDSLPPFNNFCACLSEDMFITAVMCDTDALILQKHTLEGNPVWIREYQEFSLLEPKKVISLADGGNIIIASGPNIESVNGLVLRTDQNGELIWQRTIDDSTPTSVFEGQSGQVFLSSLAGSGSRITILSGAGVIEEQYEFENIYIRDIIQYGNSIAIAAVESGIFLLDSWGDEIWQFQQTAECEIYALAETADGFIAGAGSIMSGGQRRSYLVKLDPDGFPVWERNFGYDDSFRSIFLGVCNDGGFCSAGGFQQNGTLNSFLIRTDSSGVIYNQGINHTQDGSPFPNRFSFSNPVFGSTVSLTVLPIDSSIMLTLCDLSGRVIFREEIQADNNQQLVFIPDVETGVLLLYAESDTAVFKTVITVINCEMP